MFELGLQTAAKLVLRGLVWFKQCLLAISNEYYYKHEYIGLSNKKFLFKALSLVCVNYKRR